MVAEGSNGGDFPTSLFYPFSSYFPCSLPHTRLRTGSLFLFLFPVFLLFLGGGGGRGARRGGDSYAKTTSKMLSTGLLVIRFDSCGIP